MKHTQIIQFKDGKKKTIKNIISVYESDLTHIVVEGGKEYHINKEEIDWVERIYPKELEIVSFKHNHCPYGVYKISFNGKVFTGWWDADEINSKINDFIKKEILRK